MRHAADLNVLHKLFIDMLVARLIKCEQGQCNCQLDVAARYTNTQASIHGCVIATLLHVACGYAGFCHENDKLEHRVAPLSLTIQYLAKASHGTLLAKGRRVGGGLVFFCRLSTILWRSLVATASGSFRRHQLSAIETTLSISGTTKTEFCL